MPDDLWVWGGLIVGVIGGTIFAWWLLDHFYDDIDRWLDKIFPS